MKEYIETKVILDIIDKLWNKYPGLSIWEELKNEIFLINKIKGKQGGEKQW